MTRQQGAQSATPDTVSGPGFYDLPEILYHADSELAPTLGRSLSSTGAKTILDCPARFDWERSHPVHKDAYDLGHVIHELILGKGAGFVVIDGNRNATVVKDAIKEAQDTGLTVLKPDLHAAAEAATAAVMAHPLAAAILSEGEAEKSLYWIDETTGVTCRGRVDWLRANAIVDVKSARKYGARPTSIAKASADYGYAQQAAWYRRGVHALTAGWLPFLHIFVETEAPHIVTVSQLDDEALEIGRRMNDQALALYAECQSSGEWPGYTSDIETISLPRWFSATH